MARDNFGCGSSREHAPWALEDYGFRILLAPSFADIFSNNCFKNGLLPIVLDREVINELFRVVEATVGYELEVDLSEQSIKQPDGSLIAFEVDEFQKRCLLDGLDEIGLTLEDAEVINVFEANRRKQAPWIFN